MSALFFKLRNSTTNLASKNLLDSQLDWLHVRKNCSCNADCLLKLYSERVAKLNYAIRGLAQVTTTKGCKAMAIDSTRTTTKELDGIIIEGVKKGEIVTGLRAFSENSEAGDYLFW